MRWLRAADAAREWAGGVSTKTLYAAVKAGQLKAARIGAGRNLLFCEAQIDEWLQASADTNGRTVTRPAAAITTVPRREARNDGHSSTPATLKSA